MNLVFLKPASSNNFLYSSSRVAPPIQEVYASMDATNNNVMEVSKAAGVFGDYSNGTVELINKGRAPRIPQDYSKATYEPPCDDRVAAVDFEKPIIDVYNFIRGCDPQPGAYTAFKGKKVRLYDAKMQSLPIEKRTGEIISFNKNGVQIAVKGGIIKIGKLRLEKGEKIGAMDFTQSIDLKIGERFGG